MAYAKERHIEVIPEIDMPGHMFAAIHAYPYLSADPNSGKTDIHQDFNYEIWNKYTNPLDQNAGLYTFEPYDDLTALGSLQASQSTAHVIYDLNGRRLTNPSRGINIIDSQKVLIP